MKIKPWLLVNLLVLFALVACSAPVGEQVLETNKPVLKVLAVESFLAEIAQNIAGDRVKVESLIPLGVDPHAFDPTPRDVMKIAESTVLILNGAGFEAWAQKTLDNAGGQRMVIEASSGLKSRSGREGEVAEMSDPQLVDAMCSQAGIEQALAITAGADSKNAVDLPSESGGYTLQLVQQADGRYSGSIGYGTDESGDFQFVTVAGILQVVNTASGATLPIKKTLALGCAPFTQGNVIALEKGGKYILNIRDVESPEEALMTGPVGGIHQHEGDPHFWLDPTLVVKYAENIRDGLIAADPQGKDVYIKNAISYIAKLNELDGWIRAQVEQVPAERRLIVTNHESFGYFADRYGFKIIGTIIPSVSTSAEPSAQELVRLVDHIRQVGVTAIFIESGASPKLAEQVSAETGIKVVSDLYSHSITEAGGVAPTYIDMMKYNVNAIVAALK
ncbi:MAG: metal ABC transporter substrate-binding protein [Chloroflexota bacterium]